jgi:tetratricopeptide (TPR) repeat protein
MKRLTGIVIILILIHQSAVPQDLYDLITEGNNFYIDGDFESAIEKYEAVLDSGYQSPELYYNLGNAYFKSHKLTMALVEYERALLLDPNDEEIKHNLTLTRTYVVDEIDELPELLLKKWYKSFITILKIDQWAYISLGTFILTLALLLIYLFIRRINLRKLSFWLSVAFFVISAATFIFAYHQKKNVYDNDWAIILSPSVTIKGSPDHSGTDLFQLHEGTKVKIIDQLGEWREIRLSDGNVGWLREEDLIKL